MDLSVVTTVYNSEAYLEEFIERIQAVADSVSKEYEVIFVVDGSPDKSIFVLKKIINSYKNIQIVELSRNFGHHQAIMAGLRLAVGREIFLLDCDLEEDPELLEYFYDAKQSCGVDVIYGVQKKRKGSVFERIAGSIFWKIFNFLSEQKVSENLVTARLMSRRYVNSLIEFGESQLFLGGVWAIAGFSQKPLEVKKSKTDGTSYSIGRRISLMANALTSFSSKPLLFIAYVGFLIWFVSMWCAGLIIIRKIFWDIEVPGWASLMVSIWFLGGAAVSAIGVVGVYIGKIYMEVKNRPTSIIKDIYKNY